MKINESATQLYLQQFKMHKQAQKVGREAETTPTTSAISIGFSKEKQQIQYYVEQMKQSNQVASIRIQEIKRQIERGEYQVSPEAIANSMMQHFS